MTDPGREEVVIGDSFDIALELKNTHGTQLFPGEQQGIGTVALHRAFNTLVDQLFSQRGAPFAGYHMPFDPRTAESDKTAMMSLSWKSGMGRYQHTNRLGRTKQDARRI